MKSTKPLNFVDYTFVGDNVYAVNLADLLNNAKN